MHIIMHADDFGIDLEQSKRILSCCDSHPGGHGCLNSLSILANSPHFEECTHLLDPLPDELLTGVHINIVEGSCTADPEKVDLLVDASGIFKLSFIDILQASRGPEHDRFQRQLEIEIGSQIRRVVSVFPDMAGSLRLDSHQHTHLIPAVFDALLSVVERDGYGLEYLRIPAEATAPFMAPDVFFTIKPINWAKHVVLNWLWGQDRSRLERYADVSALFCGILFSGHMDARRVLRVSPALIRRAQAEGMGVEFLFHPGGVDDASECLNPSLDGFTSFYLSEGRTVEAAALTTLRVAGETLGRVPDAPDALRAGSIAQDIVEGPAAGNPTVGEGSSAGEGLSVGEGSSAIAAPSQGERPSGRGADA